MLSVLLLLIASAPGDAAFVDLAAQAEAALHLNHLTEAVPLYTQALDLKPTWVEGWFSLATAQYDQDHYRESAKAFEKVLALNSHSGTARIMLGLCEFELGSDDQALIDIDAGEHLGAADDPNLMHVALYHQGLLLQRKGEFEAAEKSLDALCHQGVDDAAIDLAAGLAALRLRAKTPLTEEQDVVARVGRAQCLAAQNQFSDAGDIYAAIAKDKQPLLNFHYAYGRLLLNGADPDSAAAEFEQEIQLHPDHALARLQIAAMKYKVNSAAGIPYAEAAVKLAPELPLGHYLLGVLLLDTDDYQRAIPELEMARKQLPDDSRTHYSLALAYTRAGRKADAQAERQSFQRLVNNSNGK